MIEYTDQKIPLSELLGVKDALELTLKVADHLRNYDDSRQYDDLATFRLDATDNVRFSYTFGPHTYEILIDVVALRHTMMVAGFPSQSLGTVEVAIWSDIVSRTGNFGQSIDIAGDADTCQAYAPSTVFPRQINIFLGTLKLMPRHTFAASEIPPQISTLSTRKEPVVLERSSHFVERRIKEYVASVLLHEVKHIIDSFIDKDMINLQHSEDRILRLWTSFASILVLVMFSPELSQLGPDKLASLTKIVAMMLHVGTYSWLIQEVVEQRIYAKSRIESSAWNWVDRMYPLIADDIVAVSRVVTPRVIHHRVVTPETVLV